MKKAYYTYFVSYCYLDEKGFGFGNDIITTDDKINEENINEIKKFIIEKNKENNCKEVVILNFIEMENK